VVSSTRQWPFALREIENIAPTLPIGVAFSALGQIVANIIHGRVDNSARLEYDSPRIRCPGDRLYHPETRKGDIYSTACIVRNEDGCCCALAVARGVLEEDLDRRWVALGYSVSHWPTLALPGPWAHDSGGERVYRLPRFPLLKGAREESSSEQP